MGLAPSRVKFYIQAARQPKSLDTPLKGNVNSYTEEGDLLVDSIAADNGVDEKALDLQRCDTPMLMSRRKDALMFSSHQNIILSHY